ncbi:MAG: hypothetical protein IKZ53_04670 [Selenomonadaceae bacterium]|nr:hypothetical protein [Selenomonadaceae bacterium]
MDGNNFLRSDFRSNELSVLSNDFIFDLQRFATTWTLTYETGSYKLTDGTTTITKTTLQEIFNDVSLAAGDTVKLGSTINTEENIVISKSLTLSVDCAWNYEGNAGTAITINNNATLTRNGSKAISATKTGVTLFDVADGATLRIEKSSNTVKGANSTVIKSAGTVYLANGTLSANNTNCIGIHQTGGNVTVAGGTINANGSGGVNVKVDKGTYTQTSGTFKSQSVSKATLEINGAGVNATISGGTFGISGTSGTPSNYANTPILITDNADTSDENKSRIIIKEGKNSQNKPTRLTAYSSGVVLKNEDNEATVEIIGGEFYGTYEGKNINAPYSIFLSGRIKFYATEEEYLQATDNQIKITHSDGTTSYYYELYEAVDAAQSGETIVLLKNYTAPGDPIEITKQLTLDLNGKTLDKNDENLKSLFCIKGNTGDLTIKDSGTGGAININSVAILVGDASDRSSRGKFTLESGTITSKARSTVCVYAGSTFDMKGGTINKTGTGGNGVYLGNGTADVYASFNMTGGTINNSSNPTEGENDAFGVNADKYARFTMGSADSTGTDEPSITASNGVALFGHSTFEMNSGTVTGTTNFGISSNGTDDDSYSNVTMNINGGTVISENTTAIYAPAIEGVTNIKGGTLTGTTGIEIRAGSLNVEGGKITANANSYSCNPNGNGNTTTGAGIAVSQHTTRKSINVNISGGEISGYTALSVSNPQQNPTGDKSLKVDITGGKFISSNGKLIASANADERITVGISGGEFNGKLCTASGATLTSDSLVETVRNGAYLVKGGVFNSRPADAYIDTGYFSAQVTEENFVITNKAGWIPSSDNKWNYFEAPADSSSKEGTNIASLTGADTTLTLLTAEGTSSIALNVNELIAENTSYTTLDAGSAKLSLNIIGDEVIKLINSGSGNDTLIAGANGVSLNGGAGDDSLVGGDGADTFVYGAGNDVITNYGTGDAISLSGIEAITDGSKIAVKDGNLILGFSENNSLTFANGADSIFTVKDGTDTFIYTKNSIAKNKSLTFTAAYDSNIFDGSLTEYS